MEHAVDQDRLKQHFYRTEATKRANADPLPGPAGDAFALHGEIAVGPHSVRRVVASDWKILKALDSPIVRMLLELRQNPSSVAEVSVSAEEDWEIAYQFTRPIAESKSLIAKGRDEYRKVAECEIGDQIDEPTINVIRAAVLEQIRRSFLSAISYQQKIDNGGETTFFPGAGATPATG